MNRTTASVACLCAGIILTSHPVFGADSASLDDAKAKACAVHTPGTSASPISTPNQHEDTTDADNSSLSKRCQLTGDWSGLRTKLVDDGFTVSPTWIQEFFGNPTGGKAQGIEENGLFNVALDFDLEKMSGGAVTDLTIHSNALYIYGPGLSPKFVGDFSNTSNIQGYNTVRLQELWAQKLFFDKKLSIKVGNMAVDTEFFLSPSASLFINGTFGTFDLIANNIANMPVYPTASPGVRVQVLPTDKFYVMAGVYGMDRGSSIPADNHYGTNFAMTGGSGVLIMSETGYLLNQGEKDTGLKGTYRLGSLVQTGNYTNWGSQAAFANGTGNLQSAGANYSIYGVVDQQIYSKDDKAISVFMRGGGAPSNVNFVSAYIEGGFNFNGLLPGRKDDIFGLGLAHAHVSENFSNGQIAQGGPAYSEESVLESTYKIQMAPWWTIQPDFQYVMNPSGVVGSPNAVVLGVRTSVAF